MAKFVHFILQKSRFFSPGSNHTPGFPFDRSRSPRLGSQLDFSMFVHIRRHQKWLWIVISAAVIISFVWYFNPNQQMQGGGGGRTDSVVGTIYGDPITANEYYDAQREALLQYLFTYQGWPEDNEMTRQFRPIERETRTRLFMTRKLKDFDIKVDRKAVADTVRNNFTNAAALDQFFKFIGTRKLKEQDYERYVRNQIGIQHLAAIVGAPGKLVTPQEAEHSLREEREKIDTKVVVFPLSNYLAKVNVTPEAITNHYTTASARYSLPKRVQLSYVSFPSSNYVAQADQCMAAETNLNQQIDALYLQRGAQFYADLNGQPLTPEAAKLRIREEVRKEAALREARKAAYDFARGLEDVKINPANPNPAEPLENLAGAKGVNVQVTEPFAEFGGPKELNVPAQFTRMAFLLTPEDPIVPEPITGEDGAYVIAFKRSLPSDIQPLDAVRDRVTTDYTKNEASRMMRDAGREFATAATNALAGGTPLETIAQQSGFSVVDLAPTLKESRESITNLPPIVDAGALRSAALPLKAGELSSFVPTSEGGFVLLLEKVIPPTDEEVKSELPKFLQEYRRRQAVEAFNDWFSKEMQLARLTIAGEKDDDAMAQ